MEDRRQTGFTLVELLITLAVAGILAGIAVPAMARFLDKARLHAAADALAQELRHARNHALTYQRPVHFSFSAASARRWCYGWRADESCDCFDDAPEALCHTGTPGNRQEHRRSSLDFPAVGLDTARSARQRTLRFSALRGTVNAETFELRTQRTRMRVIVSPLGRVRVCAPDDTGSRAC